MTDHMTGHMFIPRGMCLSGPEGFECAWPWSRISAPGLNSLLRRAPPIAVAAPCVGPGSPVAITLSQMSLIRSMRFKMLDLGTNTIAAVCKPSRYDYRCLSDLCG